MTGIGSSNLVDRRKWKGKDGDGLKGGVEPSEQSTLPHHKDSSSKTSRGNVFVSSMSNHTYGRFFSLSRQNLMMLTIGLLGGSAWLIMIITYAPTLRLYGLSWINGLALPLVALLYTAMTVGSAWAHWRGRGGAWKGRTYSDLADR